MLGKLPPLHDKVRTHARRAASFMPRPILTVLNILGVTARISMGRNGYKWAQMGKKVKNFPNLPINLTLYYFISNDCMN